jgi:type 1 glutamine amidotransferase
VRSLLLLCLAATLAGAADLPGKGRRVVLVSGDEEYRSEQMLPELARILSQRHGFETKVLFAIDPKDGTVNPNVNDNIPGLEALDTADLMILLIRWRDLPDEQAAHFEKYIRAGKPILAMRTATHPFMFKKHQTYAKWSSNSKEWDGGFGRQLLGETWISHHGAHAKQSTRGVPAPGKAKHPILRGVNTVWGPTDVYTVRIPFPAENEVLLLGQVLSGMDPKDQPVEGPKNDPMMPVAWTRTYSYEGGPKGRVFTTTMGSAMDLQDAAFRRMIVNATFWALGMEKKITPKLNVDLTGPKFQPTMFGFNKFKQGLKPEDY